MYQRKTEILYWTHICVQQRTARCNCTMYTRQSHSGWKWIKMNSKRIRRWVSYNVWSGHTGKNREKNSSLDCRLQCMCIVHVHGTIYCPVFTICFDPSDWNGIDVTWSLFSVVQAIVQNATSTATMTTGYTSLRVCVCVWCIPPCIIYRMLMNRTQIRQTTIMSCLTCSLTSSQIIAHKSYGRMAIELRLNTHNTNRGHMDSFQQSRCLFE